MSTRTVMMKPSEINSAKFQPPQRTEHDWRMDDLVESMKKYGFISAFPLLYSEIDECLGDGHRRLEAAKILGLAEVPVTVFTDLTAGEVWKFNDTRKPITTKDYTIAYSNGLNLDNVPKRQKVQLQKVIEYIGEDGLKFLADHKKSPAVISFAEKTAVYCGRKNDLKFIKDVLYWMVIFEQTNVVRRIMDWKATETLITIAVKENRKINLGNLKDN